MPAFRHLAPLLALTLASSACAIEGQEGPTRDDDSADQLGRTCDPVSYEFLPDPTDGSDPTDARIEDLNRYAVAKLASRQCEIDDTLQRRGELRPDHPLIADMYAVEVGSRATCLNGGFLFANYDLNDEDRYPEMKDQVDMAIDFLVRLHEDMGGMPTVLFDRITLCPKEFWGEGMSLAGQTLYVNPSFTQFGHISTMDGRELRDDYWVPGELLNKWPMGDTIKALWILLDPGGTVRTALRRGVAERVAGTLKGLFSGGDEQDSAGNATGVLTNLLIGVIKKNVLDQEREGQPSLADRAISIVTTADEPSLQCVRDNWASNIDSVTRINEATEAGIAATYKQAGRNALSANVKQNGLIVVGNTHFINVNLDLFLSSGYKSMEQYVEIVETEQNIEWEQNGLVVVYTIDDININVNISSSKALPSAGLVEAMNGCGLPIEP